MSDAGGHEALDPRVAELLSAALDGAVTSEEHAAAVAWIERSPRARAEYEQLARVKGALHDLPQVEPPAGFFEAMLERGAPRPDAVVVPLAAARRRRTPFTIAASAAAAAAVWVAVAGQPPAAVTPALEGVEVAALAGREPFTVRRQVGAVAWGSLPEGDRGTLDGASTWVDLTTGPGFARVVVARDGAIYTLASDELDADALLDIGVDLPAGDGVDEGILDRARRAAEAFVDALSGG
jgi:hypothetical protein